MLRTVLLAYFELSINYIYFILIVYCTFWRNKLNETLNFSRYIVSTYYFKPIQEVSLITNSLRGYLLKPWSYWCLSTKSFIRFKTWLHITVTNKQNGKYPTDTVIVIHNLHLSDFATITMLVPITKFKAKVWKRMLCI